MYKKISKQKLLSWLDQLKTRAKVLGPERENGLWIYRERKSQDLPDHFQNSLLSPKGLFLESIRPLFGWRSSGGPPQLSSFLPQNGRRVIFAIKACDARAVRILEPLFAGNFLDGFYSRNLSSSILVGWACQAQCVGSFCREMGIDPQDSGDCDLFLRDIPGGKVAKVVTEKGRALVEGNSLFEEGSREEWESARKELRGKHENSLFDLEKVKDRMTQRFSDEGLWQGVSAKCINCGVCTYLCPTCHCFDMADLQIPGQGVRFRCWDSCAFPSFTQMAVHNPREEKWRRYRQRVAHKFYFFPQNFQKVACVGCGRCVAHCPVNLDLREVLQEVIR
jgi:ferredoxin